MKKITICFVLFASNLFSMRAPTPHRENFRCAALELEILVDMEVAQQNQLNELAKQRKFPAAEIRGLKTGTKLLSYLVGIKTFTLGTVLSSLYSDNRSELFAGIIASVIVSGSTTLTLNSWIESQ